MSDVQKITSLDAVWQRGDVVLDAEGNLRVRSDHARWVWDYPNDGSLRDRFGGAYVPDGGLEEKDLPRPLTLLVRDGFAVGGRVIDEGGK